MKNIRRLIIVMTLAVMAMIVMTGAAFADDAPFTLYVGEQQIEMHKASVSDINGNDVYYGSASDVTSIRIQSYQFDSDFLPSNGNGQYDSSWVTFSANSWIINDPTNFYGSAFGDLEKEYSESLADAMGITSDSSVYCVRYVDSNWNLVVCFLLEPVLIPAADISSCEQINDYSVSVAFSGDELDFTENYKPDWFVASMESIDGETIPVKVSTEVIDATHIKYTYAVDHSYENKLGTEKGAAKLTVSYVGASEPKTFDVTLPASSYWSKYAEEPQKIAKGDKDWPEFVGYYKISTPEELAWFAGLVNGELEGVAQNNQACAFLANDIVCNDTEGWENWDQNTTGLRMWDCTIGRSGSETSSVPAAVEFKGVFDGNYHTIKGLFLIPDVTRPNYRNVDSTGLFPLTNNATIRNLGVTESFIAADCRYSGSRLGGIVGESRTTVFEHCWFGGVLKNINNANIRGGIVGRAKSGDTIRGCYSVGPRNGSAIAGSIWSGIIEDCYSTSGDWITGGVSNSNLNRCYITSNWYIADIDMPKNDITDCYYLQGDAVTDNRARALTEEQFTDKTLLGYLTESSDAWCDDDTGDNAKNGGKPILAWQSDLFQKKREAIKQVKYAIDLDDYALSKAQIEEIIETAVNLIENAESIGDVDTIVNSTLTTFDAIEDDASIGEDLNNLKEELAKIQAKIEIQGATVKVAKASVVANGKAQKPAVTVTGKSGAVLKEGKDYTVAYKNNVKPGLASVTVIGTSETDPAVKTATFKILPKKATLKKVKPAKKKLTVTWAKDNTVTGYEVQYSLKKNFKGAKTVKITKAGTTKKVIKKLKSKKKYFVKVRSYKKAGKLMLYGAWSKAKNAKVK